MIARQENYLPQVAVEADRLAAAALPATPLLLSCKCEQLGDLPLDFHVREYFSMFVISCTPAASKLFSTQQFMC